MSLPGVPTIDAAALLAEPAGDSFLEAIKSVMDPQMAFSDSASALPEPAETPETPETPEASAPRTFHLDRAARKARQAALGDEAAAKDVESYGVEGKALLAEMAKVREAARETARAEALAEWQQQQEHLETYAALEQERERDPQAHWRRMWEQEDSAEWRAFYDHYRQVSTGATPDQAATPQVPTSDVVLAVYDALPDADPQNLLSPDDWKTLHPSGERYAKLPATKAQVLLSQDFAQLLAKRQFEASVNAQAEPVTEFARRTRDALAATAPVAGGQGAPGNAAQELAELRAGYLAGRLTDAQRGRYQELRQRSIGAAAGTVRGFLAGR